METISSVYRTAVGVSLKKTAEHYVDNIAFLKALRVYRAAFLKAVRKYQVKKAKKPKIEPQIVLPQISEFIGECFLKIATHLSYKPNFVNYTYRDDMISDGVENCLVYIRNFNPAKSKNPFGYFTTIIYFAFIRRIQREKKHTYTKYKLIEQAIVNGGLQENPEHGGHVNVDSTMLSFDNVKDFITRFDTHAEERRERRRLTTKAAIINP